MKKQILDSLLSASNTSAEAPPTDLELVLLELGAGDHRFRGTSFGRGECDLQTFLQECRDAEHPEKIPPEKSPHTTYWLLDDAVCVVGIIRVRHRLNERLLQYGGHIGYYVRSSVRRKGHGTEALRLGLVELRRLGIARALLTVHPDNLPSRLIVLAHGGEPDGQGTDPVSGQVVDRFWIEL